MREELYKVWEPIGSAPPGTGRVEAIHILNYLMDRCNPARMVLGSSLLRV
jgi:hypothetical protein